MAKEHACATIERTQSLPMTTTTAPDYGRDAHMLALVLVSEVFAYAQETANKWHTFAWRLIDGTTDMRAEFARLQEEKQKTILAENAEAHGWDEAEIKKQKGKIASCIVETCRLRTIAKAFNAGASVEGLATFYGVDDPRNIGVRRVYEYAAAYMAGNATRKADPLLVKLNKWIAAQEKTQLDDDDKVLLKRITMFANTLKT